MTHFQWKRVSMNEDHHGIMTQPLDAQRLLVCDIVWLSRHVPIFPVDRLMALDEVDRLRRAAPYRVGWSAIFTKAFAMVARERPALRSWYVPRPLLRPWRRPCWATSPVSVVSMAISRHRDGAMLGSHSSEELDPEAIYWARIREPDAIPLMALQATITHYATAPLADVFARQLELSVLPRWLRRLILRWNVHSTSAKRPLRVGTFSLSTLAGEGCANRMHPTFLTTSLSFAPLDGGGRMNVTLLADHRLLDGVPAARALVALEAAITGPIAAELAQLSVSAPAANAGEDRFLHG